MSVLVKETLFLNWSPILLDVALLVETNEAPPSVKLLLKLLKRHFFKIQRIDEKKVVLGIIERKFTTANKFRKIMSSWKYC